MHFFKFTIVMILGYELHFTLLVFSSSFTRIDDLEVAPHRIVDGIIEIYDQLWTTDVWMSSAVYVVHKAEEIRRIARAHQLLRSLSMCLADVQWTAALVIDFATPTWAVSPRADL